MAVRNLSNVAPFGAVSIFSVVNRIEALSNSYVAWNARRKTEKMLSGLSDHELNDIGLGRHEIATFSSRAR